MLFGGRLKDGSWFCTIELRFLKAEDQHSTTNSWNCLRLMAPERVLSMISKETVSCLSPELFTS